MSVSMGSLVPGLETTWRDWDTFMTQIYERLWRDKLDGQARRPDGQKFKLRRRTKHKYKNQRPISMESRWIKNVSFIHTCVPSNKGLFDSYVNYLLSNYLSQCDYYKHHEHDCLCPSQAILGVGHTPTPLGITGGFATPPQVGTEA